MGSWCHVLFDYLTITTVTVVVTVIMVVQRLLYVGCLCFKRIVETYINSEKKSESPMGFEPMTFRTPGGCSTN